MNRFDERLTRELDEIADRATMSSSALTRIRSRAANYTDDYEQEVIVMLAPSDNNARRPRWLVPAALATAAAGVLAVIGAVVLRDTGDSNVDRPPIDTELPSPAVTPSISVADLVWEKSDTHVSQVGGFVRSVVAGGPGFIAVGSMSSDSNADEGEDPAAWVSTDGLTWQSVSVEGAYDSSREQMNSVTAGGPGFVAVGIDAEDNFDRRSEAAVWVSEDGTSWQRITSPALTEDNVQEMWGITHSGSDFIAVGSSAAVDFEPDFAVWVSSDGYRSPHRAPEGFRGISTSRPSQTVRTGTWPSAMTYMTGANWSGILQTDTTGNRSPIRHCRMVRFG